MTDRIAELERKLSELSAELAAVKAQTEPFKVGDWVEAIADSELNGLYFKAGAQGQVLGQSNIIGVYRVKFSSGSYKGDDIWFARESNLRRAVNQPEPAAPKFSVGDWVEVTKTALMFGIHEGDQGKILKDDNSDIPYLISFTNGKENWAKPEHLKRIDAPDPKPALKYKAGDYVLIPFKVVEVDPDDSAGYVYELAPISGKLMDEDTIWTTRETLEPPRPAVGQRVVAFEGDIARVGTLDEFDRKDKDFPYLVKYSEEDDGYNYNWYDIAFTLPD